MFLLLVAALSRKPNQAGVRGESKAYKPGSQVDHRIIPLFPHVMRTILVDVSFFAPSEIICRHAGRMTFARHRCEFVALDLHQSGDARLPALWPQQFVCVRMSWTSTPRLAARPNARSWRQDAHGAAPNGGLSRAQAARIGGR